MPAVWLEAALNGPWGHVRQPDIPVGVADVVADGVAAAQAGAAIVHLHAYDEVTGKQKDDWQLYARIIEGIRARCDAIVYPTIPLAARASPVTRCRQRSATRISMRWPRAASSNGPWSIRAR